MQPFGRDLPRSSVDTARTTAVVNSDLLDASVKVKFQGGPVVRPENRHRLL